MALTIVVSVGVMLTSAFMVAISLITIQPEFVLITTGFMIGSPVTAGAISALVQYTCGEVRKKC